MSLLQSELASACRMQLELASACRMQSALALAMAASLLELGSVTAASLLQLG